MPKQKLVKCPECMVRCKLADENFSCLAGMTIEELELFTNVLGDNWVMAMIGLFRA